MRVGLFGGSFNPVHEGHLHVADTARRSLNLHRLIWLVSPQNPLKGTSETAPQSQRLAAVRTAVTSPKDIVSGLETDLGSPYTAKTIAWLKRRFPGVRFFWIMGSDNLIGFHRWKDWRTIPAAVEVAIVPRPGSTVRGRLARGGAFLRKGVRARFLEAPLHDASSTELRERAKGKI